MNNPWKTINKNVIFENKLGYKLRNDDVITPGGHEGKYMVLESHGFVGIVAVDKDKNVLMENIWRYPVEKEFFEIPAGTIEDGEEPLSTAKRELLEETGYVSNKWTLLADYWSGNGAMKLHGHIFLAQDIEFKEITQNPDSTEKIKTSLVKYIDLLTQIKENKIDEARTLIGLLTAKEFIL
ncbi:MAG: NUDIX hydrolase [Candidatus Shapirobacteria bacterium]|jgi:ADP-ribose pyrophosphatase